MFGGAASSVANPEAPSKFNTNRDFVLGDPPEDDVSCLAWSDWSPDKQLLAAGSWSGKVHLWEVYDPEQLGEQRARHNCVYDLDAPVLCCGFTKSGQLVAGGCGNKVKLWDLQAQTSQDLGQHDQPVKELAVIEEMGMVASGSWDKTLRFWSSQQSTPVMTVPLKERVYAMDMKYPVLIVATADRHVLQLDLQVLRQGQGSEGPWSWQMSQLKMQTRSLSIFPDRQGYAIGSVEGRCGICAASDSFTFKCHRTPTEVFSVNAIDFHPLEGTFATAGSDGAFSFWDKTNKQRLKQFQSCYYPITACKFNASGRIFAYAVSYDWSRAEELHTVAPRQVLLHSCQPGEVKPRPSGRR